MKPGPGDQDYPEEEDYEPSLEGLNERDKIVHARHGDFTTNDWKTSGEDYFPSLDALEAVMKEVKEDLWTKGGIEIAPGDVIVTHMAPASLS